MIEIQYDEKITHVRKYRFGYGIKAYHEAKRFAKFWREPKTAIMQGRWNDWSVYFSFK